MGSSEAVNTLRKKIYKTLSPIIGHECIFVGLPYYNNVGDILIWEGTLQFLKNIGCKCLKLSAKETFSFPALSSNVDILIMGGGNFGDLWQDEQKFRNKIIKCYPENKIIILPQSIYYLNSSVMLDDAKLYANHKNLYIIARELNSYKILKKHFSTNHIMMLPDMAFCISKDTISKYKAMEIKNKALFLRRLDKELLDIVYRPDTSLMVEKRDWPCIENWDMKWILFLFNRLRWHHKVPNILLDKYAYMLFRPYMIKLGVRFVSSYQEIFTTRLHVAILSLLLNKSFSLFDNSYGKNSSFYKTWLMNVDNCRLVG